MVGNPGAACDRPSSRIELRRRAFLDAAKDLFLEKGLERTTLSDIVARSGGSRSTLCELFGGKEGLFVAMLEESSRQIGSNFNSIALSDDPPEVALSCFARRFVKTILASEAIAILRVVIAEGTRFPEIARTLVRVGPDVGGTKLAVYFRKAMAKGQLHLADVDEAVTLFRALVIGDFHFLVLLGQEIPGGEAAIDRQIDDAVALFLRACGRVAPAAPTPTS